MKEEKHYISPTTSGMVGTASHVKNTIILSGDRGGLFEDVIDVDGHAKENDQQDDVQAEITRRPHLWWSDVSSHYEHTTSLHPVTIHCFHNAEGWHPGKR